jgi:hypothetical protein
MYFSHYAYARKGILTYVRVVKNKKCTQNFYTVHHLESKQPV